MDWYPKNPAHYKRKTIAWRDLRLHGAYNLLIDYYMQSEEAIPDNDGAIANILGCDMADWLAVASQVRAMFEPRDGKLHQKRCDEELEKQRQIADRNRNNGKNGGRPKGSKDKRKRGEKPKENPVGSQSPTQTDRQTEIDLTGTVVPAAPVIDPAKVIFDQGLALLKSKGRSEGQSRGLLGKWRRDYGDAAVIAALHRASADDASEPVGYIERILKNGGRNGTGTRSGKTTGHDAFQQASLEILASLRGGEGAGRQWPDDVPGDGAVIQGRVVSSEDDNVGAG